VNAADALGVVEAFDASDSGLAQKSRELTTGLLLSTPAPFSRDHFTPGHITCTALVLHPTQPLVLFMHHHRLKRWLLPGGHVETGDVSLPAAAAREALEETLVRIDASVEPVLAGIDVHGISPKGSEPYHLHHDLIWCFRALHADIAVTDEAPEVRWAGESEWDGMGIAESIRYSILRACR